LIANAKCEQADVSRPARKLRESASEVREWYL